MKKRYNVLKDKLQQTKTENDKLKDNEDKLQAKIESLKKLKDMLNNTEDRESSSDVNCRPLISDECSNPSKTKKRKLNQITAGADDNVMIELRGKEQASPVNAEPDSEKPSASRPKDPAMKENEAKGSQDSAAR